VAANLTALFSPKSVAVIGASSSPEKVGAIVLNNIVTSDFKGAIYPVNPTSDKIGNFKCFKDVKSLPEVVDLAIVAIPTMPALAVLSQIGEVGIKNIVIYTAGFKETGQEGALLEKQLIDLVKKYQLNLLGPNCFGYVNNLCPLNVTFGNPSSQVGNLRFISQSGALAASLFDWCESQNIGFSEFITLGNKATLNENDVLTYFAETKGQSGINPIGLYLESIVNGPEFMMIISRISKTTPIFILKPGKTPAAATAMKSHTGSIAGEDAILETALKQAGVIRADTFEDFFDLTKSLAWGRFPTGPRVAIISNAGGPAVVCADAIIEEGLEMAEFDEETHKELLDVLPRSAAIANPIDVLGDALADRYNKATEIILQKPDVDAVVVLLTPQVMTQVEKTAEVLGKLSEQYKKLIFCSFIGGKLVAEGEQTLNRYHIPSFRFPERAISVIGAMWRFKKRQLAPAELVELGSEGKIGEIGGIQEIVKKALNAGHKTLDNLEANNVLSLAGIPTPETSIVKTVAEASSTASKFGYPVVLKLSSSGLLHKRKIGGVVTGIKNEDLLESAWGELERKITHLDVDIQKQVGIQIQKEVVSGIEVIIGVKRDPTFGPVLLFGAGGSLVELVSDRNLRLLPVNLSQAEALVKESKIYHLLEGQNLDKLYSLLVKLGQLIEILPDVTDIEINPVIVTQNDVWAVDGKVILGEKTPVASPQLKTAIVSNHKVLASTYHYFEMTTKDPFDWLPGQFVSVKVAETRFNCYSVAGSVSSNRFNLLVDIKPGGPGSKFFEHLKVNDTINFLGPSGVFTLKPNDGVGQLLFIGTGCGLAPLKAMIETSLKNSQLPVNLYLGFETVNDVFLTSYFEELSKDHPNFKYRLIVHQPSDAWKGDVGFVTEYVCKDFPDASNCSAYLCGNKYMVTDVTAKLLAGSCPPNRIYTEKY